MTDYMTDALRTKSDKFYGDRIALDEFEFIARMAVARLQELNAIKKTLFYGSPYGKQRQTFSPNMYRLAEAIDRTIFPYEAYDIIHAIIGKATEAGESLELLLKVGGGEIFDKVNFIEEIGDSQWYDAIGLAAVGGSFTEAQTINIAKLRARFPEKFTETQAEIRDLANERSVLETQRDLRVNDSPPAVAVGDMIVHKYGQRMKVLKVFKAGGFEVEWKDVYGDQHTAEIVGSGFKQE